MSELPDFFSANLHEMFEWGMGRKTLARIQYEGWELENAQMKDNTCSKSWQERTL